MANETCLIYDNLTCGIIITRIKNVPLFTGQKQVVSELKYIWLRNGYSLYLSRSQLSAVGRRFNIYMTYFFLCLVSLNCSFYEEKLTLRPPSTKILWLQDDTMQMLAISRPFVYKISETLSNTRSLIYVTQGQFEPVSTLVQRKGCTKQKQDLKNRKKFAF